MLVLMGSQETSVDVVHLLFSSSMSLLPQDIVQSNLDRSENRRKSNRTIDATRQVLTLQLKREGKPLRETSTTH